MLTTVQGIYHNGQIILHETPAGQEQTDVIVTFLPKEEKKHPRRSGSMRGEVWISDDFNTPLDYLSDYL